MGVKTLLKGVIVAVVLAASMFVPARSVSAHTGDASGQCSNGVGIITANFANFGDRGAMLGTITITVNSAQVDSFVPTADQFTKTYKPYQNGTYSVKAAWVLDHNGNGQADSNERFGFDSTVKIENCEPKVEKCTVPGKTNLPKDDANCKVDEKCTVVGKTDLLKTDASCKTDPKCTVAGKTDLLATDANCKEDVKPAVLPATGTGLTIALTTMAVAAGAYLKARSFAKR